MVRPTPLLQGTLDLLILKALSGQSVSAQATIRRGLWMLISWAFESPRDSGSDAYRGLREPRFLWQ